MPRLAALLFASIFPASSTLADDLWRQNPINAVGGYSSQDARNAGGLGWFSEVVDNFEAQDGWTITALDFWGGYVTTIPGHTHGFTIRFYNANAAGEPGQLLSQQDVLAFTETVFFTTQPQGWNGFHTTLDLAQPFVVPAAGRYWMSIVAILHRGGGVEEPQWGWVQALDINQPPARQWFFSPGNFTSQGVDMSFVLRGTIGGGAAGACCRGSTCSVQPAASCSGVNTRFAGASTACNAAGNTTTPCCQADFNQTHGPVEPTVQDVFDFLTAFFANDPTADANNSGGPPTVQDVFDYLTAFFGGCS